MSRNARLERIKEIISGEDVDTQERLAELLVGSGFKVTQTTLSRDLKRLEVAKIRSASGRLVYSMSGRPERGVFKEKEAARMIDSFVTGMNVSGNMVIIKTMPGHAQGVAASIDKVGLPEVLGTVAGDDTIMVVTQGTGKSKVVKDKISGFRTGGKS